jgi:hypothetical protein
MSMAEEAFALSPLSASAASPTDADYHAIREAFMETTRGRWFLNEYAKRNRNADTAMVLEAVARIEQSIGAQSEAAAPQPAPEVMSEAALAALESARTAIRAEFSETGFDHTLLPWRKSARIIREITWGLRESGADPRICNILDGQARAIEAACDEFPLATIRDRVLSALDAALPQDQETAPATAESTSDEPTAEITAVAIPAPVQAPETQPETAVTETVVTEAAVAETAVIEATLVEAAVAEAVTAKIEAAMEIIAPASSETPAPEAASLEDVASEVEALLEAAAETPPAPIAAAAEVPQPAPVAPAPRSIMTASASQPAPQPVAQSVPVEAPVVATAASLPHVAPATEPAPESTMAAEANGGGGGSDDLWADIEAEIAPLPPFDPAHEASLGASLIEQGVVARPANGRADLLAPIRRMSHAERIAFFS